MHKGILFTLSGIFLELQVRFILCSYLNTQLLTVKILAFLEDLLLASHVDSTIELIHVHPVFLGQGFDCVETTYLFFCH